MSRSTATRARRGFTLLEVMVALALLGLALTVLMKSTANNIFSAEQAHLMGVVTDLSRGKMYDAEERLLKEGYIDTTQKDQGTFEAEGFPNIKWEWKAEAVELPSFDDLQAMAKGKMMKKMGSGAGSGSGSGQGSGFGSGLGSGVGSAVDPLAGFQNSALGGMLGMLGGGFGMGGGSSAGGGGAGAAGASFIQGYYTMVQQVLKASIRKVTLNVTYQVLGSDRELKTVAFFTDPAGMDKAMGALGAFDLDGTDPGAGAGSGSGSGSNRTPATPTKGTGK
jgi:general secretion pathway protein I